MEANQLSKLLQYLEEAIAMLSTSGNETPEELYMLLNRASCIAENMYTDLGNKENGPQQLALDFNNEEDR